MIGPGDDPLVDELYRSLTACGALVGSRWDDAHFRGADVYWRYMANAVAGRGECATVGCTEPADVIDLVSNGSMGSESAPVRSCRTHGQRHPAATWDDDGWRLDDWLFGRR